MTNFNITPDRRKNINLTKWTWHGEGLLPLWLADMDFRAPRVILDALHRQADFGVYGYEIPSRAYYQIIADRMKTLYGWRVDPDAIIYTPGVNNGYNIAARILCSPKKGYIIQTPVYNEFHDAEIKTGAAKLTAPLAKTVKGDKIRYELDEDTLKKAVKRAGMFLLCNPHNPVGRVFTRNELLRMAKICIENGVTIVADEIHAELLLGGQTFKPFAGLSKEIAEHTITLTSASKAFNVPGLSAAFAIIPNKELREKYFRTALGMSYEVSTPGLIAAQVAYSGKADAWLGELKRYLTSNRDFLVDYVTRHMPNARTTVPDATYLGWLDFTQTEIEGSPFEFFKTKAKVVLSDGKVFGKESAGHVRINFGTSRAILKEGLDKMRKAMEGM